MADRTPDTRRLGLQIQREDHAFRRMMQQHHREMADEADAPHGRMATPLRPVVRTVAKGRSAVRRAVKGTR